MTGALRLIWSQLRGRRARSAGLLAGIFLATTSFTVLTATSESQRLEVRGEVGRHFRTAYDLLVRPRGARSALEKRRGLVRPHAVAGASGGITIEQWQRVLHTPGVSVAAPIAIVGSTLPDVVVAVDVTGETAGRSPALVRVRIQRVTDRGLTRRDDAPAYVWVTDEKISPPRDAGRVDDPNNYAPLLAGSRPICASGYQAWAPTGPFDTGIEGGWRAGPFRGNVQCWSRSTGLEGEGQQGLARGHQAALIPAPLPFVLAAIDPEQEAKLGGLPNAIVAGRYLRAGDRPGTDGLKSIPVLAATRAFADETTVATIERLPDTAARQVAHPGPALVGERLRRWLNRLPGETVATRRFGSEQALNALTGGGAIVNFWSVGDVGLDTATDGVLTPRDVGNDPDEIWAAQGSTSGYATAPLSADDRQFRKITAHVGTAAAQIGQVFTGTRIVGRFDPERLPGFNDPDSAPLDVYRTPALQPADRASRRHLGDRPLLPNGNLAGYLDQPPLLLTNLRSLTRFGAPSYAPPLPRAPISAVRVRVAGVTGADDVSRERIRRTAQAIAQRTGLSVDVTIGSSPSPQRIRLPAGEHGRPALLLDENWLKKGVGVAILAAVDRKSAILFALILVVCALFITNAATAAVRSRRTELGVLSSVGWSARWLFLVVLAEQATLGLLAGAAGAVAAAILGPALNVDVSLARAALAIPAAIALAALAGLRPAFLAARSNPIEAVRPPVAEHARTPTIRSLTGLALHNTLRVPGRSAIAALSLAIGVAALALLLAASLAFKGALVGSVLGSAVSVQVRASDIIAVIAIVGLGLGAVADILFLNIRERSTELATLLATGWDERVLVRLIALEGTLVGLTGALAGGIIGLLGSALFAAALPPALVLTTAAAVLAGAACSAAASVIPSLALLRRPLTQNLAEE